MKKLILILLVFVLPFMTYGQESKPYNTVLNFGYSLKDDISVSIGGRFHKNFYVNLDHCMNLNTHLQSNYIGFGLGNDKAIVMIKFGSKTEPYGSTHINKTDYGIEYMWFYNPKYTYGLGITKHTGIQLKLGFVL